MKSIRNWDNLLSPHSSPRLFAWDPAVIEELIEDNRASGCQPACLVIGKREAILLRRHLGITFGPASAQSLKNTYYLGLEVIEVPSPSLLCVAGRSSAAPASDDWKVPDYFKPFICHPRWKYSA